MIRFFIVLTLVLMTNAAYAAKVTSDDISQMVGRMQTVMNQRSPAGIDKFFGFYADSEARFLKTSYLVSPDDNNKVLAEESLDMSRKEYIEYLKTILGPPSKYGYQATVNSVKMDDAVNQALVSYSTQEYGLSYTVDKEYNLTDGVTSLIRSNCNMIISYASSDIVILSINCAEKIMKKKE